jgi:hypothetical protein
MSDPVMLPQAKAETAFLGLLASLIDADVMSKFGSHTTGEAADGSEDARTLPAYAVHARDMPEYPPFTGNVRGNVEVTIMTSADRDADVANDDPEANHRRNVGLVGDALRPTDAATLESLLTAAGRAAGDEITFHQVRYLGTGEQKTVDRHFETVHIFQAWLSPSNVDG